MNTISIYADNVKVEAQKDTQNVTLTGIDVSQVVHELDVEEVLDSIDFSTVMEYVTTRQEEEIDEQ